MRDVRARQRDRATSGSDDPSTVMMMDTMSHARRHQLDALAAPGLVFSEANKA